MRQAQIHHVFQQRYNQANWKRFIAAHFAGARLAPVPALLTGINPNVATQALRLGQILLNEQETGRSIALYEVTLAPGMAPECNREGLHNLLGTFRENTDAAFIVYHCPESPDWRLSYVSELSARDAAGKPKKLKTQPKRYTYVLGEGESVHTATGRFALLAAKGATASLHDVKAAFSAEKLSQAFFESYKRHYRVFCDYLLRTGFKQSVFAGDEKAIQNFCKKLLSRLVFLYFIQKKGWLGVSESGNWGEGNKGFLCRLFARTPQKERFYAEILSKLFFDTLNVPRPNDLIELVEGEPCRIPFLNGNLFEEEDKKQRTLLFPEHLFENLFAFFNQYNFSIHENDPNDHTVAINPEILGYIFENQLEDNKNKGSFYTPKEMVHYMCQESLIEYLATWFGDKGYFVSDPAGQDKPDQAQLFSAREICQSPQGPQAGMQENGRQITRSLIERLLKKQLEDKDIPQLLLHKAAFEEALDTVKICDPAIGSGAFPMGLLHEIFTARQTLYALAPGQARHFDASALKRSIIQNSIYGLDIESGAVAVARLRFWLSLLADEPAPRPLPNLDYQIVAGNALISKLGNNILYIDWEIRGEALGNSYVEKQETLLQQISQKQKLFFLKPESAKNQLALEIRNLKIDLLVNQLELMVKTQNVTAGPAGCGQAATQEREPSLQKDRKKHIAALKRLKTKPEELFNFFDWKLNFPEVMHTRLASKTGFDIVIGNPPYVKEYTNRPAFEGIPYYQGKMDIWYSFTCVGIDLLKPNGILSFIATNNWVTNAGASIMRKKVMEETQIKKMIDFGSYMIFESACVQTMIMLFKRNPETDHYTFDYRKLNGADGTYEDVRSLLQLTPTTRTQFLNPKIDRQQLQNKLLVFGPCNVEDLLAKIKAKANFVLDEKKEIAQGIVAPQDTLNKNGSAKLGSLIKKGAGIFVLSELELKQLNLNEAEKNLIKPYYTTSELDKYGCNKRNSQWLIYTGSKYKKADSLDPYPRLKSHLDRFQSVMTSANKPYGLHRARAEYFFKGEKIISLRKCSAPTFTYTGFDCYVSQTFYIIKTNRIDLLFLTGLLNSRLMNFWLRNKGKTQGIHLQIDKQPLLQMPVYKPENQAPIAALVNDIIEEKSKNLNTIRLEHQIDHLVYKLYDLTYEEVKLIDPGFCLSPEAYTALDAAVAPALP